MRFSQCLAIMFFASELMACAGTNDISIIDFRLKESVGQKINESFWKEGVKKLLPIHSGSNSIRYDYKLFNGCQFSIFVAEDTSIISHWEYVGNPLLCTSLKGYRYGE